MTQPPQSRPLSNSAKRRLAKQQASRPPIDDPTLHANLSAFRIEERRWKRTTDEELGAFDETSESSLGNMLIDCSVPELAERHGLEQFALDFQSAISCELNEDRIDAYDAQIISSWTSLSATVAYKLPTHPGVLILPGVFTNGGQMELVRKACREWSKRPAKSNLDLHWDSESVDLDGQWDDSVENAPKTKDVWELFESSLVSKHPIVVPLRQTPQHFSEDTSKPNGASANHSQSASPDPYLALSTPTLSPLPITTLIHKLRWTSLGYPYDWFTKTYDLSSGPNNNPVPVPKLLDVLCRVLVKATEQQTGYPASTYKPEAGVINFYTPNSSLHSHQDRSEPNPTAPLISISLGDPCVFLMGELTTDEKPKAFWLRSGDVVIMSGESRRWFHGVPRVLCDGRWAKSMEWEDGQGDETLRGFMEAGKRVNINLRQVF